MEKQKHQSTAIARGLVGIMGVFILLALAGVVLGAINFASPTHYPAWILAIWLVVDILLVILVIGHIALYAFTVSDSDNQGILAVAGIIGFIAAVWVLYVKHFAWISAAALILLIVFTVIDISSIVHQD